MGGNLYTKHLKVLHDAQKRVLNDAQKKLSVAHRRLSDAQRHLGDLLQKDVVIDAEPHTNDGLSIDYGGDEELRALCVAIGFFPQAWLTRCLAGK